MTNHEAFSFGYWGWGNKTTKMLEYIDYVEAQKAYKPPFFVDIRIRRSVRAVGFRANNFEKAVGVNRYEHIPELGNQNIIDHKNGVKIKDPSKVSHLLDIIVRSAKENRRVIFFCACEFLEVPGWRCHRYNISKLLVKEAKKTHIELKISEWFSIPIKNKNLELYLDHKTFNKIKKEDAYIQREYSLLDIYNMKSSELLLIKDQETGELIKRYPNKVDAVHDMWKLRVIKKKPIISIME